MVARVIALKELLGRYNCTHALVKDCADVEYISGFKSSNAMLLVSQEKNVLFSDFRYQTAAQEFCERDDKWEFVMIDKENFGFLSQYLENGSRVGIQTNVLTMDQYRELKRACKKVRFVRFSQQINSLSTQKTATEIAHMERAAHIADTAFKSVLNSVVLGMTEFELAKSLETMCRDYGSEKPSFDTIVLFGTRAALPHGVPGKQRLKKGDIILFDFGCTIHGMCSDMSRTVVAAKASAKQKEIYEIVRQAQSRALSWVKAGRRCRSIDKKAREFITQAGYGDHFGHATGHGIGLRVHENPRINSTNSFILQENCVITVEPGVYLDTTGGVRIEDMVQVTSHGFNLLTHSPKSLIELEL